MFPLDFLSFLRHFHNANSTVRYAAVIIDMSVLQYCRVPFFEKVFSRFAIPKLEFDDASQSPFYNNNKIRDSCSLVIRVWWGVFASVELRALKRKGGRKVFFLRMEWRVSEWSLRITILFVSYNFAMHSFNFLMSYSSTH